MSESSAKGYKSRVFLSLGIKITNCDVGMSWSGNRAKSVILRLFLATMISVPKAVHQMEVALFGISSWPWVSIWLLFYLYNDSLETDFNAFLEHVEGFSKKIKQWFVKSSYDMKNRPFPVWRIGNSLFVCIPLWAKLFKLPLSWVVYSMIGSCGVCFN